ncbi:hypothetical protein GP486_000203 [Trichoglossum hirsutum]|uniref:CRESS-DNA virus Rep endonuclease domain-containing protein n=1 Tax=Trichoglossum hirsutum TaxID=265104 RepID=A0A9P8LJ61_9PEZI|nr:hypothetical protein GP486_000203 [Trichoglossum hirsutum]
MPMTHRTRMIIPDTPTPIRTFNIPSDYEDTEEVITNTAIRQNTSNLLFASSISTTPSLIQSSPPQNAQINPFLDIIADSKSIDSDDPTSLPAQSLSTHIDNLGKETDSSAPLSPLQVLNNNNMGRFRFSAKSIFLMYPRCDIPSETFNNAIQSFNFAEYYTVREEYKDRTPHYYVLAEFKEKPNIKNSRKFNIQNHHCNIQKTRNRLATWRYLHKKDGSSKYVGGTLKASKTIKKDMKDDFWSDAVQINNDDIFVTEFKRNVPKEFILSYCNISAYRRDTFVPKQYDYEPPFRMDIG